MDPPDAHDDAAYRLPHQCRSGELSTKQARQSKPTAADFYIIVWELQNQSGKRIGSNLSEENWFHSFFGASATTALQVWNLLNKFHYLHHEAQILHLLWTLFFMKVYPSQNVACATAGGWGGAIDPKTLCIYVWPMIEAIANLEQHGVSR